MSARTRGGARRGTAVPNVDGIIETALSVANVPRSAVFYRRLFGFDVLMESERLVALDVGGRDVLLLFREGSTSEPFTVPGGVIPGHAGSGGGHFAFSVTADDLPAWRERLEATGVRIESAVAWEGGAQSLYFRDPDDHLVELITPGFWRVC